MENINFSVFVLIVAAWNLVTFLMYGLDKFLAKHQKYRISEKALLSSTFLLGGVGAVFGMQIFRHKTKHTKFRILVPLAAVITVAALVLIRYPSLLNRALL